MLTLKFYAGGDAPPRLPVRVLPGVTDVRMSNDRRLVYSMPSPGLVSRGRDDVSYLPLSEIGAVEVFNDAGVSLAVLNAGPEVLTVPADLFDGLTDDERRRMQGGGPIVRGWRQTREATDAGWKVTLERPLLIDSIGGYPALGLALQSEGYSFGQLSTGFGWWRGTWLVAQASGDFGYADSVRQVILGAEEHYRDAAEREPGDVGDALRTRAGTILARARRADSLSQPRELRARVGREFSLHVDEAAFLGTSTEGLSQALIDEGYTLQKSENASCAWRWRKGEALSDWFNGDDARDRCIAELTRQVFGKACGACSEKVGQPHHSTCPYAGFLGDTVCSDQAADLDAELNAQVDMMTSPRIALIVSPNEPLDLPVGFDAVHAMGSSLGGRRFDAVYLSLSAALTIAQTPGAWGQSLRRWVNEELPLKVRPGGAAVYLENPPARHYTELVERVAHHAQCGSDALADALAEAGVVLTPDTLAAPAEIEDLTRPLEGTNDTPEPAPTVSFSVNGETYETTAGTRSGKALYERVGGLSGQMLVTPAGTFVGDTDLVDIQGGEVFTTTAYRDPIARPEPVDPAVPAGHVVVILNGTTKAVDPEQVKFVGDLWRVLQLSPTSGLKVNKPGKVTVPLPDPNAAYKLEKGDAFESYLCERRFSGAEPVQITVDGTTRKLVPGVYTRPEMDVLFGCGGWDLTQNGKLLGRCASATIAAGDTFTTDIPF